MKYREKSTVPNALIGMHASMTKVNDPSGQKVSGVVIDETKNMIIIEHKGTVKKYIKSHYMFEFTETSRTLKVKGADIIGRGEERIKKWLKKQRR